MKKRLLCLFLCLVMLLSVVFTSCSDKTDEDAQEQISQTASKNAMTLTMWIVSEEVVDEDIRISVTEALNSIAKSKFKTQLVLNFFTEDEYYEALTDAIKVYEQTKAAENKKDDGTNVQNPAEEESGSGEAGSVVTDEYVTNDLGRPMIKYPEALANQVDIIYIGDLEDSDGDIYITGEQMHNEFVANGWLAELDKELTNNSKKISEYVSPTLLSAVKQQGVTYAIPNNNVIGEYTYMLLNKELMDRYSIQGYFNRGMIDSFNNQYVYQYLTLVYLYETAGENPVLPVDATYEECLSLLAHYWNIDPDDYSLDGETFSIFGSYYEAADEVSRGEIILEMESLFDNEDFVEDFLQLNYFKMNEKGVQFFKNNAEEDTSGKTAAIKFLTGDLTVLTEENGVSYYKEGDTVYYVVPVKYPTAQSEDIYGNMFGVCSLTQDVGRSMEIITYLNTNVEFRNILQYGVANVHYRLNDAGEVVRLANQNNKKYMMDIYATGNAFLAYLEPTMSSEIWESGKVQNRNSLVAPLLGFDLDDFAQELEAPDESVSVDTTAGYQVSYTTGYSKAVLSQNADIKAWLERCDRSTTEHVFFYATYDVVGLNYIYTIYVYNNAGSGTFELVDTPIEVQDVGSNGMLTTIRKGVTLNANYSDMTPGGSTLSIVSFACRKGFTVNYASSTSGTAASSVPVTERHGQIDFDFMDTEQYKVDIYENLTIPHVIDNAALYNQLKSWYDNKNVFSTTSCVLAWEDKTSSATENYYTYVIFRNKIKYVTELDIQTVADANKLELKLDYISEESKENEIPAGYSNYMLTYVHVTTDKDVDFSYEITLNGGVDTAEKVTVRATEDPDFRMYGNLDTELIKYMDRLNTAVLGMINECTTYEELETLVSCLELMLSGTSHVSSGDLNNIDKNLANELTAMANTVAGNNTGLNTLFNRMRHIINYETMDIVTGETNSWPDKTGPETYVYYDSPYGIYYQWLEAYGYLPS